MRRGLGSNGEYESCLAHSQLSRWVSTASRYLYLRSGLGTTLQNVGQRVVATRDQESNWLRKPKLLTCICNLPNQSTTYASSPMPSIDEGDTDLSLGDIFTVSVSFFSVNPWRVWGLRLLFGIDSLVTSTLTNQTMSYGSIIISYPTNRRLLSGYISLIVFHITTGASQTTYAWAHSHRLPT